MLILIRERKKEKQMEGKKNRGREKYACAHSCRKKNFGTLLGKCMREEEANSRMLKYRHETGIFSLGLLQFFSYWSAGLLVLLCSFFQIFHGV